MKKTKIRKEVKYSSAEWNKVCKLAKESGILPAAYIRDRAVNGKIIKVDCHSFTDDFKKKENAVYWGINDVAKTVNTRYEQNAKKI